MPTTVKKQIEKMQRSFFWGDTEEKRTLHTVDWGTITQTKQRGGLGVPNLKTVNMALLNKWIFRYGNERQSLWRMVIVEKNGWNTESLFPDMAKNKSCSNLWRNTVTALLKDDPINSRIKNNFGCLLGNGSRIKFWTQQWVEGKILQQDFPRIYQLAVNKEAYIAEYGAWDGHAWHWNIDLRRNLFGWELGQWSNLMSVLEQKHPQRDKEDKLIWMPNSDGIYTVKSAKKKIEGNPNTKDPMWNKIWSHLVPPKVGIFLWKLIQGKVAVRKVLKDKGMLEEDDAKCILCREELETCYHLFFGCQKAWQVWMIVCRRWGSQWTFPGTIRGIFISWTDFKIKSTRQAAWRMSLFATCWSIWLSRNECNFQNRNFSVEATADLSIIRLYHWFQAKFPSSLTVGEALKDPSILCTAPKLTLKPTKKWTKPPTGYLKFNVDASVVETRSMNGIGGILRNNEGKTKAIFSKMIECQSVEIAEFQAILEAMRILDHPSIKNQHCKAMVETDSIKACQWCNNTSKLPWRISHHKEEFDKLKLQHGAIFNKIPREINQVADNLAKAAVGRCHPLLVFL